MSELDLDRTMEEITYMYHDTSGENMKRIEKECTLLAKSSVSVTENTSSNSETAVSTAGEYPTFKGVWFSCSTFNGKLPKNSPFGEKRVVISIASVMDLIEDPHLYFMRTDSNESKTSLYHQLILSDGQIDGYDELPLEDNGYMTFAGGFRVKKLLGDNPKHKWVHVCVLRDIPIPPQWQKVTKASKTR